MAIVCLDMDGVLVPEIWISCGEKMGVSDLGRTMRVKPERVLVC